MTEYVDHSYDVIVIGGGPAGATAALLLARQGMRTIVIERETFPRFHIGESLLPRNFALLEELGLAEAVSRLPHVDKLGVTFEMGDAGASARFGFADCLLPGGRTVSLERAPFDAMLLQTAQNAGALVRQGTVRRILRLAEQDVIVDVDGTEVRGRWLIDASGQATVVARHLRRRRLRTEPHLRKAAYFAHFQNVWRAEGEAGGDPVIVMCDEGWFWLIPLDGQRTSVGLVIDPQTARSAAVPSDRILQWGLERCPAMQRRMQQARGPKINLVAADFSYSCRPYAGPGYFLLGDAATFVDPIFSTGVCLAMIGAQKAADLIADVENGRCAPQQAQKRYGQFVNDSSGVFFRLIRRYYDHSFRELFLSGSGPLQVHRAILAILAGHVFPRPPWALRWRLKLFEWMVRVNRIVPLVPRRERFSLMGLTPDGSPATHTQATPAAE